MGRRLPRPPMLLVPSHFRTSRGRIIKADGTLLWSRKNGHHTCPQKKFSLYSFAVFSFCLPYTFTTSDIYKAEAMEEHQIDSTRVDSIPPNEKQTVLEISRDVEESHPSATSPYMLKLYAILSVGYFCIILQGYDSSLMGAINAMPQYLEYYGL
jgi:hypothetical protein